jgi:hypothetical protein
MAGSATNRSMGWLLRAARGQAYWITIGLLALLGLHEAVLQLREDAYLSETAARVIREARAETPRDQVIALRDYVRATVHFQGAPGELEDRPFLRATAEDTLRSGLGWCGEDSRAFINLARAAGIEAQRVNLYGSMMHVVAEVELVPHQRLIVDAQSPPYIADLELLDDVIRRPEFDDYYTLNLRRLHLGWLVSRVRFEMGALTFWAENPHALSAALWMFAAALMLAGTGARRLVRIVLHRRGWVHRSTLPQPTPMADDEDAPLLPSERPDAGNATTMSEPPPA